MAGHYDCIIIGAGITGTAIAHELSKFKLSILLLEKGRDVALGATRANSGIVHGGYTAKAGTLKGEFAIRGNRMYRELASDLGFPFRQVGSYVLAFTREDTATLESLLENGARNGVKGLVIETPAQALKREPLLNPEIKAALYCPETGIVSPYEAAIAMAEASISNGATAMFRHEVTRISRENRGFSVACAVHPRGIHRYNTALGNLSDRSLETVRFSAGTVINAAGLYADRIAEMAGIGNISLTPKKGQYLILKRGSAKDISTVIFQPPTERGKGILVSPTTWGNLMIGPNSEDTENREDTGNRYEALADIYRVACRSIPSLSLKSLIRTFSGTRPSPANHDFIVGESDIPGFIQAAGIESPGLTSAPAIAARIREIMQEKGYLGARKERSISKRRAITSPAELLPAKDIVPKTTLSMGNPERIVCRCEQVPEAVIMDALGRNIPIDSVDAVKRRTRAGMGVCQGQYCAPRVTELIKNQTGMGDSEIEQPVPKDAELIKRLRQL